MQANNAYSEALVELQLRRDAAAVAAVRASAAGAEQQKTRQQIGRLAGDPHRDSGLNPALSSLVSGSGNALQQAATLAAVTAGRASDAQRKAVSEARAQRTVLVDQLANLRNTTVALESARVDAVDLQRQHPFPHRLRHPHPFPHRLRHLPRTASQQFAQAPVHIPLSQAQPGDLLVWGPAPGFCHVATYVGGGRVVQALNEDAGITVTALAAMSGVQLHPVAARY